MARSCPLACESAPLTGTAHLNGFRTRQQVRVALGCGASQGDGATPRWPLRSGGAPPAHRLRVRQGPGARRRPHGPARLPTPRYGGGLWPTARLTSATSNRAALVQGPARQGVASLLGRDHTAGCDGCLRFSGSMGEAEPRELSYTTHRGLSDRPSSAVACSNTSVWRFGYTTTLFVDAPFMSGHDLAGPSRQEFTSFAKDQWFA